MSPPGIAVVGPAEFLSPWLLRSISRHARFEAVCDERAEAVAQEFHARWTFESLDPMLQEIRPDGVILAHSVARRPAIIKQCLAAGIGVLVLGVPGPPAACRRLATLANLSGRPLLAAPALRYAPAIVLARRLMDSGQLASPISLSIRSTWRGCRQGCPADHGPVPLDQAFEALDLAHHLAGATRRIFALSHSDGATVVAASTAGGVPVSMVLHPTGPTNAVGVEIEIRAVDGGRLLMDNSCHLTCMTGSKVHAAWQPSLPTADPAVELGFSPLVAEFARLLTETRPSSGMIGPTAAITAACRAFLASAGSGRAVSPNRRPPVPEMRAMGLAEASS